VWLVLASLVACGAPPEGEAVRIAPKLAPEQCDAWGNDAACAGDAECGDGFHCFAATCWRNQRGAPCERSAQCGERHHCTQGCCWWDFWGEPCSRDDECGGGKCANGTCTKGE
jgi:hypothetical protein